MLPFGQASRAPQLQGGYEMKSIWSSALAALAALVTCSLSGTALAGKPEKVNFSVVDTGFLITECDGFDVLSDSTIEGFFLLKTDDDGNPVSARQHQAFVDDVWYNSTNPEISINAGPGQVQNDGFDFIGDPPTWMVAGVSAKVTLPGYGVVFQEAGLVIFDLNTGEVLRKRGPSDLTEGNSELLCSLLAS
jgi:hypothetical protein